MGETRQISNYPPWSSRFTLRRNSGWLMVSGTQKGAYKLRFSWGRERPSAHGQLLLLSSHQMETSPFSSKSHVRRTPSQTEERSERPLILTVKDSWPRTQEFTVGRELAGWEDKPRKITFVPDSSLTPVLEVCVLWFHTGILELDLSSDSCVIGMGPWASQPHFSTPPFHLHKGAGYNPYSG